MALTSKTAVSTLALNTRATFTRKGSHLLARNRMTTTSFSTHSARTSLRKILQRFSPANYLKKWMILNATKLAFPKSEPLTGDPEARTCMIRGLIVGTSRKSTIEDMLGRVSVTHLHIHGGSDWSLVSRELLKVVQAAGYKVVHVWDCLTEVNDLQLILFQDCWWGVAETPCKIEMDSPSSPGGHFATKVNVITHYQLAFKLPRCQDPEAFLKQLRAAGLVGGRFFVCKTKTLPNGSEEERLREVCVGDNKARKVVSELRKDGEVKSKA